MLTPYDWVYGISAIAAVVLSVIAGGLALSMYEQTSKRKYLSAWNPLIVALILFAFEEVVGALKVFGIWHVPWLRHVIPSFILVFLIAAVLKQINVTRGCPE